MSGPPVEETVGTRLLKAMLTELQMLSSRYKAMDEEQQAEIIDRLRGQIQEELRNAIDAIAAKHYQSVTATLDAVAFGEKVSKLKLHTPSGSKGLHALADLLVHGKGACMIVLADLDQFTGGMEQIKPAAKQRDWTQGERDEDE
jgi:hypothetical protein